MWGVAETRKAPSFEGADVINPLSKGGAEGQSRTDTELPHRFLSLVRAILVSRLIVLTNVWIFRFCHQVPSGQYLIPIDSTALHGAN